VEWAEQKGVGLSGTPSLSHPYGGWDVRPTFRRWSRLRFHISDANLYVKPQGDQIDGVRPEVAVNTCLPWGLSGALEHDSSIRGKQGRDLLSFCAPLCYGSPFSSVRLNLRDSSRVTPLATPRPRWLSAPPRPPPPSPPRPLSSWPRWTPFRPSITSCRPAPSGSASTTFIPMRKPRLCTSPLPVPVSKTPPIRVSHCRASPLSLPLETAGPELLRDMN
jgi:hypothetical protein